MIAFVNAGADTRLLGQLERRLEHVHEQARRRVETRQGLAGGHALQAAVPDQTADDRPVLLLDPRLVVLPKRSGPRELDVMLVTELHQRLVEKLAPVVGVDPQERKRECAAKLIQRVDHQTCFAHQERHTVRPAAGDIGQHQRPREAAGHGPATVRDQVGFDEPRRGILPIAEGAHRDAALHAVQC